MYANLSAKPSATPPVLNRSSVPGPKTGLRQMVQARYSFGKYGVTIPIILNLCTLAGFCVIDCVLGGQALSAVAASADFSSGNLSTTVGIVIIAVVALVLSFFGVKVLHQYERYAWIPVFVGVLVATGCGGSKLHLQTVAAPAEAATVLSFGALIAGFFLPWGTLASDFVVYHDPDLPSWKIAGYTFSGLAVPSIPLMVLGAAIGGAVPQVDSWNAGYEAYSAGGILAAMLQPAGNFGKFILVLLALSVVGNVAGTMYCLTLNCQLLLPLFRRVPRALFAIVVTAVIIPVSIKAVTSFFDALENFIGMFVLEMTKWLHSHASELTSYFFPNSIGYWASCFVVILVLEHAYFRRQDWGSYDPAIYNDGRRLPTGLAALGAGVCAFGLIIPCMAQIPYTGPIAEKTGDIGFEVGWFLAGLLYIPFRTLEIRMRGRL